MAPIDIIKQMQAEGKSEQEIIASLHDQNVPEEEITNALTQIKIKQAVAETPEHLIEEEKETERPKTASFQGMQASMMSQPKSPPEEQEAPPETPAPIPQANQTPQAPQYQEQSFQQSYQQNFQPQYPAYQEQQYQQPSEISLSSDTISEIAEQVVMEKIQSLRKELEKSVDSRTLVQSRIEFIDERLKRIEKIIDRLQLSILQKVGEYTTNIEDIKHELIETQKTFKAMAPPFTPKQQSTPQQQRQPQPTRQNQSQQ